MHQERAQITSRIQSVRFAATCYIKHFATRILRFVRRLPPTLETLASALISLRRFSVGVFALLITSCGGPNSITLLPSGESYADVVARVSDCLPDGFIYKEVDFEVTEDPSFVIGVPISRVCARDFPGVYPDYPKDILSVEVAYTEDRLFTIQIFRDAVESGRVLTAGPTAVVSSIDLRYLR